jgi:hypothetical protein
MAGKLAQRQETLLKQARDLAAAIRDAVEEVLSGTVS